MISEMCPWSVLDFFVCLLLFLGPRLGGGGGVSALRALQLLKMSGSFRSTRFSRGNQVDGSPRILIELPHISVRLKEKKRKKGKERKGKERSDLEVRVCAWHFRAGRFARARRAAVPFRHLKDFAFLWQGEKRDSPLPSLLSPKAGVPNKTSSLLPGSNPCLAELDL